MADSGTATTAIDSPTALKTSRIGPAFAPVWMWHPVNQGGDIAGLEAVLVEVAAEGDPLV